MAPRDSRRDLVVLALGLTVSTAGDAAALVALLLRLRPAGSAWVAGLLAAELLPIVVLAPIAGAIVDRLETRRLLVTVLLGQAAIAVPLALLTGPLITVLLFSGLGAFTAVVRPATAAVLPAITGEDDAAHAYSGQGVALSAGWIAGPAVGGLLTAASSGSVTLLVDGASFLVVAAACLAIRTRRPPAPSLAHHGFRDAFAGLRLLRNDAVLRVALLISGVAIGCAVIDNVATPFRFINQLHTDAFGFAVYLTIWSAGALAGSLLFPLLGRSRPELILALANALTGAGICGIGAAPTVAVAYLTALAGGFGNGMSNVGQNTLVSIRAPAALTGRAFAASGAVLQLAIGAGTAAAAPLIAALGPNWALVLAGASAAGTGLLGTIVALTRSTRDPRAERRTQL